MVDFLSFRFAAPLRAAAAVNVFQKTLGQSGTCLRAQGRVCMRSEVHAAAKMR